MDSLFRWTLMGVVGLLLIGCAQQPVRDRSSAFYQVPAGSELTLHDTVAIKPGHTRTFAQRGVVTEHSDLDQYYPSCSFEVRDLREEPQQINPDSFVVTRVQLGFSQIVAIPSIQLAGWNGGLRRLGLSSRERGEPLVASFYHLWLSSSQQPNVMRLTCYGAMADLSESFRPTFSEIEEALGALATIEP
ncbi:MAG: hypothetical protein OQL27_04690 [Sedimenticola sp.]|nr:hypothetical protein [Sedimenticola sp.]